MPNNRSRAHIIIAAQLGVIALLLTALWLRSPGSASAQVAVELTQTLPTPTFAPGAITTISLQLRNNIPTNGYTFEITVDNLPAGVVVLPPGSTIVGPSSTQFILLQIRVPSNATPGAASFVVRAAGTRIGSSGGPTTLSAATFAQYTVSGATPVPTPTPRPDAAFCSALPLVSRPGATATPIAMDAAP